MTQKVKPSGKTDRQDPLYQRRRYRRPPLSEQKEFRAIKNTVIQEAENIRMGIVSYEDADFEPERTDLSKLPYDCQDLWLVIQDDTAPMEERDDAVGQLQAVAERGDAHTQYLMGGALPCRPSADPGQCGGSIVVRSSRPRTAGRAVCTGKASSGHKPDDHEEQCQNWTMNMG